MCLDCSCVLQILVEALIVMLYSKDSMNVATRSNVVKGPIQHEMKPLIDTLVTAVYHESFEAEKFRGFRSSSVLRETFFHEIFQLLSKTRRLYCKQ